MRGFAAIAALLIFAVLGLCVPGCRTARSDPKPSLLICSAEVDITPPIGHRMAGYLGERLSTGIHDPLYAKALVLKEDDKSVAFVFCDLLGVSLYVSSKARELASRRTGIRATDIVICATHTHTGPLYDDVMRDYYHETAVSRLGKDPAEAIFYPDYLIHHIAEAVKTASETAKPGSLLVGAGKLEGLSFNRRYVMTNGTVQFNPGVLNPGIVRPAGPVDPSVGIILARDADKRCFAGATVFGCHCDTTGGTLYSADYPFYLSQALKEYFGCAYVSAFAAGPCGDVNHINVRLKNPSDRSAVPQQLGTNLAAVVVRAAQNLRLVSQPSLDSRSRTLAIPLQETTAEQSAIARHKLDATAAQQLTFADRVWIARTMDLAKRGAVWPVEVQVFRLDQDTAVVCLPGEIFAELGLAIKRGSPFSNTLVLSICNDRPGYVPTLKAFQEGSYEISNSRIQPGGGEKLVETALGSLRELKR